MSASHSKVAALTVLLLLLLGVLAGCGSDDENAEGGKGSTGDSVPGAGKEPGGLATWSPARADCTNPEYPQPRAVTTSVEVERDYTAGVIACTSDQQPESVWLHNIGDDVWTLDGAAGKAKWLDWTLESVVFRETFDQPVLLLPGDVVLVGSVPDDVSWSPDKAYAVAWETQAEGVDRVQSYSSQLWAPPLRRSESPARVALASCTLTAHQVADAYTADPAGFDEELAAALSSTSDTAGCGTRWERAWRQGFQPSAQFLGAVSEQYRDLSNLERVLRVAIS